LKTASRARQRFAICVENRGCDDLQVGKAYRILIDKTAAARGHLRVVDDSGEDYLYPTAHFVFVELPQKVRRALAATRRGATSRTA
jgi:hypothetical protein